MRYRIDSKRVNEFGDEKANEIDIIIGTSRYTITENSKKLNIYKHSSFDSKLCIFPLVSNVIEVE